jgi:hypothetical protein
MAGFGVVIETYHVSPVRNPSFMQQRLIDLQKKADTVGLHHPCHLILGLAASAILGNRACYSYRQH